MRTLNFPTRTVFLRILALLAIPVLVSACKVPGGVLVVKPHPTHGHGHPPAAETAPPAHAPAHGYRAKQKHRYHYYPESAVYFDSGRGLYFYISNSGWTVSATLPSSIKLKIGSGVEMELETDTPYEHHDQHKKKYPPGQEKKKNKGKGKGKDKEKNKGKGKDKEDDDR